MPTMRFALCQEFFWQKAAPNGLRIQPCGRLAQLYAPRIKSCELLARSCEPRARSRELLARSCESARTSLRATHKIVRMTRKILRAIRKVLRAAQKILRATRKSLRAAQKRRLGSCPALPVCRHRESGKTVFPVRREREQTLPVLFLSRSMLASAPFTRFCLYAASLQRTGFISMPRFLKNSNRARALHVQKS
jgi:hypothetical protein